MESARFSFRCGRNQHAGAAARTPGPFVRNETWSSLSRKIEEDEMKLCFQSLFAGVVLGLTLPAFAGLSRADEKPKPVKTEKTWGGLVKIELRNEAPGYITDKDAWAKFWKLYRGEEKLPEVDFKKELILVVVNHDPNGISILLAVDAKGDLKVDYASTEIEFINPKTCAYQIALIKRAGIKKINGMPITSE
jgi:hypothetical protein